MSFLPLHSFHLFLLFLSDMKSQHCLWCQCVSILTDRSVRNKILMLVSDEAKGEYRWQEENQRSERGVARNTHNRATGGNAESKDNFTGEGRGQDFFPRVQQDHPKCVCHLEYSVEALLLHSFWLGSPWRCRNSGHMLLLSLFTPSATADPLDWSQDYRISKS